VEVGLIYSLLWYAFERRYAAVCGGALKGQASFHDPVGGIPVKPSSAPGAAFELEVLGAIRREVASGSLGLLEKHCRVFHHKAYFSRDRQAEIIVDISIEIYMTDASTPSIVWVWECKDYSNPVPVDDLEEFHSKLQQMGSDRTKGTVISRSAFQKAAIQFAMAKGIGLARLLADEVVYSVLRAGGPPKEITELFNNVDNVSAVLMDADGSWTPLIRHANRAFFGLYTTGDFDRTGKLRVYLVGEVVNWWIQTERAAGRTLSAGEIAEKLRQFYDT
jgi:hypothetical protein